MNLLWSFGAWYVARRVVRWKKVVLYYSEFLVRMHDDAARIGSLCGRRCVLDWVMFLELLVFGYSKV